MSEQLQELLQNDMKQYFNGIQADEALKTHTREFIARKIYKRRAKRRFAAAFACLFLLLLIGGGRSYFALASTISVDVNPSIELGINRYDRVISVKAFNEEGNALIKENNVWFLDYRDALHVLLETDDMEPYFTEDSLIDITIFGTNDKKTTEMLDNLASCTSGYRNVHCSSDNSLDISEAHAHGMSCGKYSAYLELQALDPSVTTEEAEALTMRQIRDRIYELSKEKADGQPLSPSDEDDDCDPYSQKESTDETVPVNEGCGSGHHGKRRRGH